MSHAATFTPSTHAFVAAAACAVAATFVVPAPAATLSPGMGVVGPTGTTVAAEPGLAGTVVQSRLTPFSYTGWFTDWEIDPPTSYGPVTGLVQSQVVLAVDGTYDFYWRIAVSNRSFLPLATFTLNGFGPATYNANFRSDRAGLVQPATISESTDGVVSFAFGQYIPPSQEIYNGQSSYSFFLDTDARAYSTTKGTFTLESERDSGGSMMIDWGGVSRGYLTFAPVWGASTGEQVIHGAAAAVVPEPATAPLAAAGLLAIAWAARRCRRSAG